MRGHMFESALAEARRAIHDNDVERLRLLVTDCPALLSWTDERDVGGLLGMATGAFGDAGDPERERWFTRARCAERLIDAGAVVTPAVCEGLLRSRARGLLDLFHRKALLPRTLTFFAAVGDPDAVRAGLDRAGTDLAAVNEAFVAACHFGHEDVAAVLLSRSVALDAELRARIGEGTDRGAVIKAFGKTEFEQVAAFGLGKALAMEQVRRTVSEGDVRAFVDGLRREPWLLGGAHVAFQNELIETAAFQPDPGEFIGALLDLDPAILRSQPPPRSRAIEWAVMYANAHLLPLLTRIWGVPDDLPFAAGTGDLARVQQWFDDAGLVRDAARHYPWNDPDARGHLHWDPPTAQQVLDVAFAFAVINRHFGTADILLARGANLNTNWNSHEPASILHHLVFLPNPYEPMRYLIDRGIDMSITDYRWRSTATGWARHGKGDEAMARWLENAEQQRVETARRSGGEPGMA